MQSRLNEETYINKLAFLEQAYTFAAHNGLASKCLYDNLRSILTFPEETSVLALARVTRQLAYTDAARIIQEYNFLPEYKYFHRFISRGGIRKADLELFAFEFVDRLSHPQQHTRINRIAEIAHMAFSDRAKRMAFVRFAQKKLIPELSNNQSTMFATQQSTRLVAQRKDLIKKNAHKVRGKSYSSHK